MAYRAEIQIGVSGIGQLNALQKTLNQLNSNIDRVNAKEIQTYFNIQNINTYNTKLKEAADLVNKVKMGSPEEVQAIKTLVQAKNNQIAAQERLNKLIEREMLMQQKIVATANAGYGQQGPALPPIPGGSRRGPVSPIGGAANIPGSPAAIKAAADAQSKMAENLMLGAGFPLLFGGGAGQVAGGLLGSFIGTGFGGQIIGSAVFGIVEDLAKRFQEITVAAKALDIPKLKESTIFVNDKLAVTVDLLKQAGKIDEARALLANEIADQTGVLPEYTSKLTQTSGILGNTWNKFLAAASGFAAILTGPTAAALTVLLSGFTKILQNLNAISSVIANKVLNSLIRVIEKSAFFKFIIERILNGVTDKTEEQIAAEKALTMEQLKNQKAISDAFVARTKAQIDAATLTRKLNGDILTDYYALIEIEAELKKNNEDRFALMQQMQAIRDKGGIAAGIATPEQFAALETQLKTLENKKLELKIAANKESLALFEKEIKATAERATRALELRAAAVRGSETAAQSEFTLQKTLNDLYSQRLDMEVQLLNITLEQTDNLHEQLAIFDRLREIANIRYKIALSNAKVERDSTYAQIRSNLQLLAIEIRKQQVAVKVAEAVMFEARAKNLPTQDYINAVQAQYEALQLSRQNYDFAVRNAAIQERIADAVYQQKVEAAGFARNLEIAGVNARENALLAQARGGGGAGQQGGLTLGGPLVLGATWTGTSFTVPLKKMARGGYVTSPTASLIGEGGQGEYVIPESKAAAFAMNYMLGSRGAAAIPDSGTPAINITTGPVMQQNGQNYVTMQDFEQGLQTMASSLLGNNRSAGGRRYAGVS